MYLHPYILGLICCFWPPTNVDKISPAWNNIAHWLWGPGGTRKKFLTPYCRAVLLLWCTEPPNTYLQSPFFKRFINFLFRPLPFLSFLCMSTGCWRDRSGIHSIHWGDGPFPCQPVLVHIVFPNVAQPGPQHHVWDDAGNPHTSHGQF